MFSSVGESSLTASRLPLDLFFRTLPASPVTLAGRFNSLATTAAGPFLSFAPSTLRDDVDLAVFWTPVACVALRTGGFFSSLPSPASALPTLLTSPKAARFARMFVVLFFAWRGFLAGRASLGCVRAAALARVTRVVAYCSFSSVARRDLVGRACSGHWSAIHSSKRQGHTGGKPALDMQESQTYSRHSYRSVEKSGLIDFDRYWNEVIVEHYDFCVAELKNRWGQQWSIKDHVSCEQ